jgi:hypothetical protein
MVREGAWFRVSFDFDVRAQVLDGRNGLPVLFATTVVIVPRPLTTFLPNSSVSAVWIINQVSARKPRPSQNGK